MSETTESIPVQDSPSTQSLSATQKNKRTLIFIIFAVVLVLGGALIAYRTGVFGDLGSINVDSDFSPVENKTGSVDPSAIVAVVNGVSITRGELNEKLNQIRSSVPGEAMSYVTSPDFERQVLDSIIDINLLTARAKELNISIADSEVDAEIKTLVTNMGGQVQLDTQMQQMGITMEQLRTNVQNELMIRALLARETKAGDVSVTDEEIKAAYDLAAADGATVPPYDEVKEILKEKILNDKRSAVNEVYISTLRDAAKVERSL